MDIIEYMKNLSMPDELINKLIKYNINHDDLLEKINNIYELLGFAGLTDEEIGNVLFYNISLLNFSLTELCKLAYVLENLNLGDSLSSNHSVVRGIINYKRAFMRGLVTNLCGGSFVNHESYLTSSDYVAYGSRHHFYLYCYKVFGVMCSSDEELEKCLDGRLKCKGKTFMVDDYIKVQSSIFYRRYLEYKNRKRSASNGKSI